MFLTTETVMDKDEKKGEKIEPTPPDKPRGFPPLGKMPAREDLLKPSAYGGLQVVWTMPDSASRAGIFSHTNDPNG